MICHIWYIVVVVVVVVVVIIVGGGDVLVVETHIPRDVPCSLQLRIRRHSHGTNMYVLVFGM